MRRKMKRKSNLFRSIVLHKNRFQKKEFRVQIEIEINQPVSNSYLWNVCMCRNCLKTIFSKKSVVLNHSLITPKCPGRYTPHRTRFLTGSYFLTHPFHMFRRIWVRKRRKRSVGITTSRTVVDRERRFDRLGSCVAKRFEFVGWVFGGFGTVLKIF